MDTRQAYAELGLNPGASDEQIVRDTFVRDALLAVTNDRRQQRMAGIVRKHDGNAIAHRRNQRVGRAKVDADRDQLYRVLSNLCRNAVQALESEGGSAGGLLIGARRNADPGHHYWRITQWLFPWYTLIPPYKGNALNGHAWVPMDDTNNMAWTMTFHPVRPLTDAEIIGGRHDCVADAATCRTRSGASFARSASIR